MKIYEIRVCHRVRVCQSIINDNLSLVIDNLSSDKLSVSIFMSFHVLIQRQVGSKSEPPTTAHCLVDRALRREHPLGKCCSTRRIPCVTGSFTSNRWGLTDTSSSVKLCKILKKLKTSHLQTSHLPMLTHTLTYAYSLQSQPLPLRHFHLLKQRSSSGKPLAFRGISGKGLGNRGASQRTNRKRHRNGAAATRTWIHVQCRNLHKTDFKYL